MLFGLAKTLTQMLALLRSAAHYCTQLAQCSPPCPHVLWSICHCMHSTASGRYADHCLYLTDSPLDQSPAYQSSGDDVHTQQHQRRTLSCHLCYSSLAIVCYQAHHCVKPIAQHHHQHTQNCCPVISARRPCCDSWLGSSQRAHLRRFAPSVPLPLPTCQRARETGWTAGWRTMRSSGACSGSSSELLFGHHFKSLECT